MGALSKNRQDYHVTNNAPSSWYEPIVVTSQVIYRGAVVGRFKSGANAGKVRPMTADTTLEVLGFSMSPEPVTGDGTVRAQIHTGVIKLFSTGLAATDEGKIAYGTTDQDFVLTSGGGVNPPIGRIERVVSSTVALVWVGGEAVAAAVIALLGAAATEGGAIVIFADAAEQTAYPAASRFDGLVAILLDDGTLWDFDTGSSASATDWVRVPDADTGRWLRRQMSVADMAATTAGHGAHLIGSQDAGSFTAQTTVEGQLQEIFQNLKSVQYQIDVDVTSAILAAGTPMAAFADNASSNPGVTLVDSEAVAIRWNNNASQTAIWYRAVMPQDLDDTADIVLHILASKTGATLGDATTFTVTAFFQTVGALHDADANAGGASSAMTGDATAKTVQELTLTLAAADVPPSPSALSFSVKPTDGTLGTDDVCVHAIWFEAKRKLLPS